MDLSALEQNIGLTFKSKELLEQALVHRSYLNEHPDFPLPHNERLEFLGDAVLELVVTDHLYRHYDLPEGELTNLRAAIVRGEMLSRLANDLKISDFLLLSRGESQDYGKARAYILANAFEAIIGAIYLDQSYAAAADFIQRQVISQLPEVIAQGLHIDNKSRFQEIAQEKYHATPSYHVLRETGLDHAKRFVVGVFLRDRKMGEGEGLSKQEAQQKAAKHALENLE